VIKENLLLTLAKTSKLALFIIMFVGFNHVHASYKEIVNNYVLHSRESDSLIVQQLAGYVKQCVGKYSFIFGYQVETKIDIYLTASANHYKRFNPPEIPEWSGGVAFINQNKIVLKPGSYFKPATYRETLFHEIAHFYIANLRNAENIPLWLNEGLAMYLSEKSISWSFLFLWESGLNRQVVGSVIGMEKPSGQVCAGDHGP
jgi:hypothetical protein